MNDPEKQARKQSVDFAVTKKPSSLSDFDESSKRSETLSDLQDVESTDLDMHNLELEVVSVEEAQQSLETVQVQVMNLRLGMSHLHAILADIEKRLRDTRMLTQQTQMAVDAQDRSFRKIKDELTQLMAAKQQCMDQVNAIVNVKNDYIVGIFKERALKMQKDHHAEMYESWL